MYGNNTIPNKTKKKNLGTLKPSEIHQGAIAIVLRKSPVKNKNFSISKLELFEFLILLFII
jgi:hypothetical protein